MGKESVFEKNKKLSAEKMESKHKKHTGFFFSKRNLKEHIGIL